jgi:spermidine synthase
MLETAGRRDSRLKPSARTGSAYVVFASLAAGFTAFVFLYTWARGLPSLFPSPVLTGGWAPCSVLAGIAAGCLHFGRKASSVGRAPRAFSVALFGFGLAGIPVWQLLRMTEKLPAALLDAGITSAGALSTVLAVITFCLMFVPGFLLGGALAFGAGAGGPRQIAATFPLWSLFVGFAAGPVFLVFGMLPHLGSMPCMVIAAGVSAGMGLVGFVRPGFSSPAGAVSRPNPTYRPGGSSTATGAVLESIHVLAVLAWVVIWFRLILLATGPSLHAVAALLTALFVGLGAGSGLSGAIARRGAGTRAGLGIAAGANAVLLLYLSRQAGTLPLVFLDALGNLPLVWADLVRAYFAMAFLTLFAPALLLGVFIGLTSGRAYASGAGSGSATARFALASLGALLVTRFMPTEVIPLDTLIVVLPWIASVVSLVLLMIGSTRLTGLVSASVVFAAMITLSTTQPRLNPMVLSRGLYAMPPEFKQVDNLPAALAGNDLLFYCHDPEGTVSVDRTPDAMTLRIDGSVRSSAESGMVSHILAGHIPLLVRGDAKKVLIDGLGAGLTLGAVEKYPLDEIHCAEPSAAAVRATGLFSPYNGTALEDTRLNLHRASIRNHLLVTGNRYDVIWLESPPPFSPESAQRLTTDFFSLARSKLAPAGILCQHVSTFDLPADSFRSVAKSFAYHFPFVTIWWLGGDDVLLLGSSQQFVFAEEAVRNRMSPPEVAKDLSRIGMTDPLGILSCFAMTRDRVMDFCGGAALITATSNRLLLEWPQRTLQLVRTDGLTKLGEKAESPSVLVFDLDRQSTEYKFLRDRMDRCESAHQYAIKSLVALREGKVREAVSLLGESPTLCPLNGVYVHGLADYYIVLSRTLLAAQRFGEAVDAARRAVELLPGSPRAYYSLASIELKRDPTTAAALLERAITLNPYYVPAYLLKAQAELAMGEPKKASETVGSVLPMEPFNLDAHHIRGLSFIQRRMYAEGRAELELVLEAEPENVEALDALAYSWLVEQNLDEAERLYERLLRIEPDHLGALNNYATILAEKGKYQEAIMTWTRALELSPGNKDIIDNIEDARQSMRR